MKKTTIFQQIIEVINRKKFTNLVEKHKANHYVKQFDAWSHCLTMIYSQISNQDSLRSLEMNFSHAIQKEKLNKVVKPKRSTLSEANSRRPASFFQDVCSTLIEKLQGIGKYKHDVKEALQLIDSTPIQLGGRGMEWIEKTQRIEGLKGHFVFDTTENAPVYFSISSAKRSDLTDAKTLKIIPNQIYVFDRAYYDFSWWSEITEIGSTFVTRSKSTLASKVIRKNIVKSKKIKSDNIIKLTSKKGYTYKGSVRLVKAEIEIRNQKKTISILTNNFDLSAIKIAEIYKKRWGIELFFKWLKQNLKIKKFFGQNENAIKIQIITAVIVYLLLKIMTIRSCTEINMRRLLSFLRNHLFYKTRYHFGNTIEKINLPKIIGNPKRACL